MCYKYKAPKNTNDITAEFGAVLESSISDSYSASLNGFKHPYAPLILNATPQLISLAQWGLMPAWAKDNSFQKNTLNCMIETASEKPSFRDVVNNRCLILADEFYEYKWEEPGKPKCKKHLYAISAPGRDVFAMAGIYSVWRSTITYTIITTVANELMADIHNNKKRMPVVLHRDENELWLKGEPMDNYRDRTEIELKAVPIGDTPPTETQGSLF